MANYWITKYALSIGIKKLVDAELYEGKYATKERVYDSDDKWDCIRHFYGRKDWHATEEEAKKKANQMREAKIASLKKQITKLDKMKF